jgi:hypothetical protein
MLVFHILHINMNEELKIQSASAVADEPKATRGRSSLAKVLPTDRLSFEKQKELLRAFAAEYTANGGQPVTNEKAGEIIGLSGSTISQTNGFFTDVGIVTRAEQGGFIPGTEVIEYNNACQWDESEARTKLRPLFERTWFYRCLVPRLHLSSQSKTICLSVLASESKASPDHNERLENLISFLELAGIVSESGGTISLQQAKPSIKVSPQETPKQSVAVNKSADADPNQIEVTLYLDKDKKRKFTISTPLFVTAAELKRIQTWIEAALIIEGKTETP